MCRTAGKSLRRAAGPRWSHFPNRPAGSLAGARTARGNDCCLRLDGRRPRPPRKRNRLAGALLRVQGRCSARRRTWSIAGSAGEWPFPWPSARSQQATRSSGTECGRGRRRKRCRTRRALAAARGHNQSACRCGQSAHNGRVATSRRSGEPTIGRRSCPRITDCLKPHCVSPRVPRDGTSATVMARAGQLAPGVRVSRSDVCTASRAPDSA